MLFTIFPRYLYCFLRQVMIKNVFLTGAFVLASFISFSQNIETSNLKVVNDPLLWNNTLRLKAYQRSRIMQINEAFYNAIIVTDPKTQPLKTRSELSRLMHERSEEIWNTFSSRQKNIWKKLTAQYYGKDGEAVSL
jgi:hypothetical protein